MWGLDYAYYMAYLLTRDSWRRRRCVSGEPEPRYYLVELVGWTAVCLVLAMLLLLELLGWSGWRRAAPPWLVAVVFLPAIVLGAWTWVAYRRDRRGEKALRRFWGRTGLIYRLPPGGVFCMALLLPAFCVAAMALLLA